MKVLVIPTTDWTNHPVPNRLNHIFERIAGMGHEVHVLHFHYLKYARNHPMGTKCNLIHAGTFDDDIAMEYVRKYREHKKLISTIIREKEIDVILSANILPSLAANNVHGDVPIVYDYLDVMDEAATAYLSGVRAVIGKIAVERSMKRNLNGADQIITTSPGLIGHLKKKYKIPHEHIPIIPNGVDCGVFKPLDKKEGRALCGVNNDLPIIGYVGTIEKWVDLELAIKAMGFIRANLVLIGPRLHTDEIDRLKKLAEPYDGRVIFIGAVPYNTLPQYISSFDVGINPLIPSDHNIYSAGGKIFNYLACSVPCVSSECDPGALVKDKLLIYHNPDEYVNRVFMATRMKQSDRDGLAQVAQHYDWNKLAKKYEEVLLGVV